MDDNNTAVQANDNPIQSEPIAPDANDNSFQSEPITPDANNNSFQSELIALQKRQNLFQMITMILVGMITIAVIVVSAIIVPKAVTTFNNAEKLISQVESSIDNFSDAAESISNFIDTNMDSVTDALGKLGEIDIDSLNSSIEDLSDVLSAFSMITDIFK